MPAGYAILVIVLLSLLLWAILLMLRWRLFDTESFANFQENLSPAQNFAHASRRSTVGRPQALGGGMVKAAWFRAYAANELPALFDRVVQSWDTASKATELSDFSVCTSWGIAGKDLYLLHVLRKRMEYPIKCWG